MGCRHEMDLECWHVYYYMVESIWQMAIWWIHDSKGMWIVISLVTDTWCCWFYQMFRRWYNPRTNKFEYGLNPKCVWYNMMGEEIGWRFTISTLQIEDQAILTLEETSEGPCLKNDVVFALLITIFPHTVTMFNEIGNLIGLDVILNGEP